MMLSFIDLSCLPMLAISAIGSIAGWHFWAVANIRSRVARFDLSAETMGTVSNNDSFHVRMADGQYLNRSAAIGQIIATVFFRRRAEVDRIRGDSVERSRAPAGA